MTRRSVSSVSTISIDHRRSFLSADCSPFGLLPLFAGGAGGFISAFVSGDELRLGPMQVVSICCSVFIALVRENRSRSKMLTLNKMKTTIVIHCWSHFHKVRLQRQAQILLRLLRKNVALFPTKLMLDLHGPQFLVYSVASVYLNQALNRLWRPPYVKKLQMLKHAGLSQICRSNFQKKITCGASTLRNNST